MEREYILYTAEKLLEDRKLCFANRLSFEPEEFNGKKLARFTLENGNYTPDDGCLVITDNSFDLFEYPYMAVSYRTKSCVFRCDMSISYTDDEGTHESWAEPARPEIKCDMNIRSFVYDVRHTDSVCFPKRGYKTCSYILKPFGGYGKTVTVPFFFSIEYIGFFKDEESAKKYNREHKSEVLELSSSGNAKQYRVSEYAKRYYGSKPVTVFNGFDIKYNVCLAPLTHELDTLVREDGTVLYTATPRFYKQDHGTIVISSAGANFSFLKRPCVKLALRSSTHELEVQVRADNKRTDYIKLEGESCSCGYDVYTFDITKLTEGENETDPQCRNITLAFRAGRFDNVKLTESYTVELRYIAFFENAAEAALYTPNAEIGESEYLASHSLAYIPAKQKLDYTELDDHSIANRYIAKANEQKERIRNYPNNYTESNYGKTYYISSINGDDENDGLSPEKAWRTCKHINTKGTLEEYDYVLFERGSLFRESVELLDGVVYSAYGEGEKPRFYGSIDATGKDSWSKTDVENVWVFKDTVDGKLDIGNIIADSGAAWGIKALVDSENIRKWQGYCYNGFEGFEVKEEPFESYSSLKHNMEYWHDHESGKVYLYLDRGNPGEYFKELELAKKVSAFHGHPKRCVLDNVCVKYVGMHGIGMGGIRDVTIQYCELGWIGGSIQAPAPGATGRLGNAVECFGYADGYTIHDCYAYQVYDCCFTTQWQGSQNNDVIMNNIKFYNNVAELSNTGLETWLASHAMYTENKYMFSNMELFDNYNLCMGYGWSHQRVNKNGNFFYGDVLISDTFYENCRIHDNVNVYSSSIAAFVRYSGKNGFNFFDNTYVMERDRDFFWTSATPTDGSGRLSSYRCDESGMKLLAAHSCELGSKIYSVPSNSGVNEIASFLYEKEGKHEHGRGLGNRVREY